MVDDDKTRWAVDVMTAWIDEDSDTDFVHERIDAYLSEPEGCSGLITGLINLTGLLLMGMEVGSGKSTPQILRAIASTLSRDGELPDVE